jgi:hypothetical protein
VIHNYLEFEKNTSAETNGASLGNRYFAGFSAYPLAMPVKFGTAKRLTAVVP